MAEDEKRITRRDLLRSVTRAAGLAGLGGSLGFVALRSVAGDLVPRAPAEAGDLAWHAPLGAGDWVWQIDPDKCIGCGNCATYCVLKPSAVKCVHSFKMCGRCDFCGGFFEVEHNARNSGAENQLCPTGAITRTHLRDIYYEYTIDDSLCIGCGRCVKGCLAFGNGSLFLQVRHDICVNCNECAIAVACPSGAFRRVPRSEPYLLKDRELEV